MLASAVKVLETPVNTAVERIMSFGRSFSFLCDFGCFGMVVLAGY